jgi:WD40 repeat protein
MTQRFTLDSWSGSVSKNLSFTADGKNLIFTSEDGALVLLDASGPEGGKLLANTGLDVSSYATSPDGSGVACVGNDRSIIFWDLERRQTQFAFSSGGTTDLVSLAYSPDGQKLAAGYTDGSIYLLDASMKRWEEQACRIANRNLTSKEWNEYQISADQGWRKWWQRLQFWKDENDFYRQRTLTCPNMP